MSLEDKILNKLTGSNYETQEVDEAKIIEIIKEEFIQYAINDKEKNDINKIATYSFTKSRKRNMKSHNGRYEIFVLLSSKPTIDVLLDMRKRNRIIITDNETQKRYAYYAWSFKKLKQKIENL